MILGELPLARLRFDLETTERCEVPPYKGDLLRMGLLWWLSTFWCEMPDRCRHGCRRPGQCTFGRLCEPVVDPSWPSKTRHLMGDTPPPAYALWDGRDRRRRLGRGVEWSFELTLVGALAVNEIPAVIAAVQQGSEQGMGREHVRSTLHRVTALSDPIAGPEEPCCLADEQPCDGGWQLAWQDYRTEHLVASYARATEWMANLDAPICSLSLRFLSPVQIREHKRWVEEPLFAPLMRALVRRLRMLSQVHGGGEWAHDEWGPLLDLAEEVELVHDETFWTGYARRSKRSGRYEIEGFIGQAWYDSRHDLRPLLPALWMGQWLHVGKGYVLGNGRYRIERAEG